MADEMFGWELLLNNTRSDIKKKEDVLLLLIHYQLVKSGYKCAGNGEQWNTDNETVSEVLPKEWNTSKEYILRYKCDENRYTLMSHHNDNVIIFNFAHTEQLQVTNLIFKYDETVMAVDGDILVMVPSYKQVMRAVQDQLLSAFAKVQTNNMQTQTTEQLQQKLREPRPPGIEDVNARCTIPDFEGLNAVGRRDLDPLGAMGGGGGMLFDPLRENRSRLLEDFRGSGLPRPLPRGSVPPSARFDPFGPPDRHIPGRRDLPPDYDDMFS